jgi:phytoene dehydrogenase-like protein
MDAVKYGRLSEEPILEATIPSLTDPSLAPEGKHVMSVTFQAAPYALRDAGWTTERDRVGEIAVKTLERYAPGFGELVEAVEVVTPADLEATYGLTGGHLQHAEPALDQFFAWRPLLGAARYRFLFDGLYLAGSGAHPGGGITGGPGANAAKKILKDL